MPPYWFSPSATPDPFGHQLASIAAVAALQLGLATPTSMAVPAPGGGMWGAQPPPGGGAAPPPGYTADGLALLLRHQLCVLSHQDLLRAQAAEPAAITPAALELLSRASRRFTA